MKEVTGTDSQAQNRFSAALWAVRLIWQTSAKYLSGMLIGAVIRGVVPAALALAIRGLINSATDAVGPDGNGSEEIMFWLVLALAITVVDVILVLVDKLFSDYLRNDLTLSVNSIVMRHASSLDLPYLENAENRELLDRVRQNPGARLHGMFTQGLSSALSIIQVASLVAVLAWLEPLVLLIAPVVAVPFMVFHWRLARVRYMTEYNRTRDRRWSGYFLSNVTSQSTIGEIKQLGIGELLTRRFIAKLETFREQDRKIQFRQFRGGALFSVTTIVAFYALFARVVYQVLEGVLTIGDMAIFAGAVARLRSALQLSIRSAAHAYEQTLYIADLRDFLESTARVVDVENAITDPVKGDLRVNKLQFSYPGSSEVVLREVSFHLKAGAKVAIVGENGSGKSTLAKLLVRLYDADSGEILLDGKPIAAYKLSYLHSRLALLGQAYGRYEASAEENIAYADWERLAEDCQSIEQYAEQTGFKKISDRLPQGLNTNLGRRFSDIDLSAGQWQLLAITRTLAREASVLILDEPTSNIDARSEFSLFKAIEKVTRGLTTIVISHRFSTIRMMDKILVMHQGRIVEQGSHEELMAAAGRYKELYTMHEHYRAGGSP